MTRIFVEDIELDINGEISQQLTFAIDDLNNLDSKSTSFSKTIVIPGTNNNNLVFGNIFEFSNANFDNLSQPNVFYNFNASRSAKARIEINGLQAMKGVMRLLSIIIDKDKVEYEIALFGELGGFVASLANRKLTDIDFSGYNHQYISDYIINSWEASKPINIAVNTTFDGSTTFVIDALYYYFFKGDVIQISGTAVDGTYTINSVFYDTIADTTQIRVNTALAAGTDNNFYIKVLNRGFGSGFIYPFINYGNVTSTFGAYTKYRDFLVEAFRPAIFVKTYFDRIISDCGYTYESNFMDSDFFKRLIIPHNESDMFNADVTEYINRYDGIDVSGVTSSGNPSVAYNLRYRFGSIYDFTYNSTPKTFTFNGTTTKQLRITADINGTTNINYGSIASLDLLINGVSVQSYPLNLNGITNVNFNIDYIGNIAPNDTIEVAFNAYDSYTGFPGGLNFMTWVLDLTQTILVQNDPPQLIKYSYGDMLNMNNLIPKNILQKDFVTSLMKMFNLMVVEDKETERHLIIEPYIDFFDTDRISFEDWSNKVDRSKPIRIKPMSEVNARIYNFKYKQDADYYNDEYRKKFNEGYGDRIYDNQLEFAKDSQSVEIIFSSSVLTKFDSVLGTELKIYPSILKVSGDVEERINHNIRIMQCKIIDNDSILGLVYDNVTTPTNLFSFTKYCYAGHVDDPYVPTSDINWGSPQEIRFPLTEGTLSNNLFNVFYSPYMAEITDKDSRLVTCEMYLNEIDIFKLDFSKFKMIDGVLYRLSKVIDWSSPSTCKVDLLRVINTTYSVNSYNPSTISAASRLWAAINYDGRTMNDGTTIPLVDNITDWNNLTYAFLPCCAYPNFDAANKDYGLLYNFNAISNPNFEPEGWRLPEYADFNSLIGLSGYAAFCSKGMYYWNGNNGTDLYGFDARGAGYIQGFYADLKEVTAYWGKTTTPYTNSDVLYIANGTFTGISIENRDYSPYSDSYGWSVRFIKKQ